MKTKLPERIASIPEAVQFLTNLHINAESYHPEDDSNDIIWNLPVDQQPTEQEKHQLNKLMMDIYALPGNDGRHADPLAFDPCGWLLELDNENEDEAISRLMEMLGYVVWDTGGNCQAYVKAFGSQHLMITDEATLPEKLKDPITVGLYETDTDENYGWKEYTSLLEFFIADEQEVISELRAQKLNEK